MSEIHSWLYLRLCTVLFYRLNLITSKFPLQAFLFLWFSKQHSYCSHYFARNRILLLFYFIFNPHLKICLLIWERERERERKKETLILPPVCALTGNQTDDTVVCKPVLSPLSHTGQGSFVHLKKLFTYCWVSRVLYIFWIQILFRYVFCEYFHPVCDLSFHFKNFFYRAEVLNFDGV